MVGRTAADPTTRLSVVSPSFKMQGTTISSWERLHVLQHAKIEDEHGNCFAELAQCEHCPIERLVAAIKTAGVHLNVRSVLKVDVVYVEFAGGVSHLRALAN